MTSNASAGKDLTDVNGARFCTENVVPSERFAYWRELTQRVWGFTLDPFCANEREFRAELRPMQVDAIRVASLDATSHWVRRDSRLIRQSDPEMYKFVLAVRGDRTTFVQGGREAVLTPGQMVLYETSHPLLSRSGVGDAKARMLNVTFPRHMLRLPGSQVRRLTAVPLPGHQGIGEVVGRFLEDVIPRVCDRQIAASAHLSESIVELITAVLADRMGNLVGRQALFLTVQAYILQRLADPYLSPAAIAATHHVSLRYLQVLFKDHGTTIAGWIRDQRLEWCRRDLHNPSFGQTPVSTVGARWGLVDAQHFSRMFRAKYGLPPGAYRSVNSEQSESTAL
jgi:AraC-like DNA-binding protein